MSAPAPADRAPRVSRGRWTLVAIAIIVAAPVVFSYGFYYFAPAARFTNYGELLPTQPFPVVQGTRPDGKAFDLGAERGHWTLLLAAPAACDAACAQQLYATRQARTIQGKESDRVVRVWLATGEGTPPAALLAQHPDLVVVRAAEAPALPKGAPANYLVDPIGNQVLAWPAQPDIKAMARDIGKVLKASRIG